MPQRLQALYRRIRHRLVDPAEADPAELRARVDPAAVHQALPEGNRYAVLVPVRDAAADIEPFFASLSHLGIPAATTKLVFCEGDSGDNSWEKLQEIAARERPRYRDIVLLQKSVSTRFERGHRSDPRIQFLRRNGLARVRNHLVEHGLDETDDWALWIDIDVCSFPTGVVQALRDARARIVVPNCVSVPGGPSVDLASFISTWPVGRALFYRHLKFGLFQPPSDFGGRLHLSSLRHSERVELDSVGGTLLLVDAALHRGGLGFPERPYRGLMETEGFGALAKDIGVRAVGLPRLEIRHVPTNA